MGNIIGSFFSGVGNAIASLFNTPLDFLSGKSCNSACGATWDFMCYLENFCVTHLLKMAMVLVLCYMVLLFFYLLYKLGICSCVGRSLCRFYWACIMSCFSTCDYCCNFFWVKTLKCSRRRKRRKRRRRGVRDNENYICPIEYEEDESSVENTASTTDTELESRPTSRTRRGGSGRADRLRNSLRPRSHHIRVNVGRSSLSHRRHSAEDGNSNQAHILQDELFHDVRISRTSKFARKGRTRTKDKRRHRCNEMKRSVPFYSI